MELTWAALASKLWYPRIKLQRLTIGSNEKSGESKPSFETFKVLRGGWEKQPVFKLSKKTKQKFATFVTSQAYLLKAENGKMRKLCIENFATKCVNHGNS